MSNPDNSGADSAKTGAAARLLSWSNSSAVPAASCLLVVILAFAWYAFVHWEKLNQHHQQQLARAAELLQNVALNAQRTVENVCGYDINAFLAEQPYLIDADSNGREPAFVVEIDGKERKLDIDVARLLLETPRPQDFEHLLWLDQDGKVVRQFTRDDWTDDSSWSVQKPSLLERPAPALRIVDFSRALASADPPIDFAKLSGSTGRFPAVFSGERFQVYTQPARIDANVRRICDNSKPKGDLQPGDSREWTLVALAPYGTLQQRSFSFETYFVGALTLFPLIAALGFPFVKLLVLGAGERFRYLDVAMLFLSTSALTVLLTILVQAGDSYRDFSRQGDDRLVTMAETIRKNLTQELLAALGQVALYDDQYADKLCRQQPCLLESDLPADCAPPRPEGCSLLPPPSKFRNVDQIAWIGDDGVQLRKASVIKPYDLLNVSQRRYFQAVAKDELFTLSGADRPFFVRPDRSITTGGYYSFLSAESKAEPKAVVLTFNLASINEQPLHPGYGFAVVDPSGTVLYHSDPRLPLRENLFAEVSRPRKLQAVLAAGKKRLLSLTYYAQPHKFYVAPFTEMTAGSEPAWTIVTFRDLSVGRAAAVQAVSLSVLWPVPILTVFGAVLLYAFGRLKQPHPGAWLWPHEGKRELYVKISIVLAALAFVTLFLNSILAGAAVMAAVSLALYFTMKRLPDAADRKPLQSVLWHRAFLLLVVFQLAVIPARGLFRMIWNYEMGKLYNYEQSALREQRDGFQHGAREHYAAVEYQRHAVELLTERESSQIWPRPSEASAVPPGRMLRVHKWIAERLPIHTAAMTQTRYRDAVDDSTYRATSGRWTAGGALVALLVLLWWIRYNANTLFFADVSSDGSVKGDSPAPPAAKTPTDDQEAWKRKWQALSADEQSTLARILVNNGIVNPKQHALTRRFLRDGLLELRPGLQASDGLDRCLAESGEDVKALAMRELQSDNGGWSRVRWILLLFVLGFSLFLFATQPDLPTWLTGAASAVTTLLTVLLRIRDSIGSWFSSLPKGV